MTDSEINWAIAEACGWKVHPKDKWIVMPPNSPHSVQPLFSTIPNFCADLNDMHEAEKLLTSHDEQMDFVCATVVATSQSPEVDSSFSMIHATARQRAEAFLRTLNLWKD